MLRQGPPPLSKFILVSPSRRRATVLGIAAGVWWTREAWSEVVAIAKREASCIVPAGKVSWQLRAYQSLVLFLVLPFDDGF